MLDTFKCRWMGGGVEAPCEASHMRLSSHVHCASNIAMNHRSQKKSEGGFLFLRRGRGAQWCTGLNFSVVVVVVGPRRLFVWTAIDYQTSDKWCE